MKQRLINAIMSKCIEKLLNKQGTFPLLLQGGYEDIFSKLLFLYGFQNNSDLISQWNRIDLASFNGNGLTNIVEFGHQFSLQFVNSHNSALGKLKSDGKKRRTPNTVNSNFYAVQIITDVISLNKSILQTEWGKFYSNRYGINSSIGNRKKATDHIKNIINAIDVWNSNSKFNITGTHLYIPVRNQSGEIVVNFIINGPYNYNQRLTF